MKIKKFNQLFENIENMEFNFYEDTYLPEKKEIVGSYMITGETENSITLLNIRESVNEEMYYADDFKVYSIDIYEVTLPKKYLNIYGDVPNKEGFKFIGISYWLYKKNTKELKISRIEEGINKRLTITRSQANKEYLSKFKDENVLKYFNQIKCGDTDMKKFISYKNHFKN